MRHLVVVLTSFVLHKKNLAQISDFKSEVTGRISDVDLSKDSAFTHVCSCLQHSEDMVCIPERPVVLHWLPSVLLGAHEDRRA